MIRVSILYPKTAGGRFDHDYYVRKHMPMSIRLPKLVLTRDILLILDPQ